MKVEKKQTNCPITGDPISKKHYVDYNDRRVYFCCHECPPKFLKEPETYIKQMQAEGVELERTPAAEEAER